MCYFVENTLNGACFRLNRIGQDEGEFTIVYMDPYGKGMLNNKNLKVSFNKVEVVRFNRYRSQVNFSNNVSVTTLPMKDIREIANKTFFNDDQKRVVDFVRLIIIDTNKGKSEFLLRYDLE